MAQVRPFRAIRYSAPNISALAAPPYDILNEQDKALLLARSSHNVVSVDLPQAPAKVAGPPHIYEEAGRAFRGWVSEGVLKQDPEPALYVYHQDYTYHERAFTRKMFFAQLRLEEFGRGQIFPHEQTFGGPKEDRLMLTRAVRANLSPIFGLYPDQANEVIGALDAQTHRQPDSMATLDGVENRLWLVTDRTVVDRVCELMRSKSVFIADGHHRYGTSLMYRDELMRQGNVLADDHPANHVLCVLAGMEDPGLLILPTHRVLCDLPMVTTAALRETLANRFEILQSAHAHDGPRLVESLASHGPQAFAAYSSVDDDAIILNPRDRDMLTGYEPERAPAWRRFSLSILHRYVLNEVVASRFLAGGQPVIHYIKDDAGALADAKENRGIAFMVQPATMQELRDICTAGELMPQKSTYFFPKLATGMVINPLS